jgi:predicted acylesterase/phospholipase RssA
MYIDGGMLSNYPVKQCLANGANPDEILGLNRVYTGLQQAPKIDTLVDYLFYIIGCLHSKVVIPPSYLKNQIELYTNERFVSIYNVYNACADCVYRKKLLDEGVAAWRTFYAKTYLTPEEPTDTDEVPDVNV